MSTFHLLDILNKTGFNNKIICCKKDIKIILYYAQGSSFLQQTISAPSSKYLNFNEIELFDLIFDIFKFIK